MDRLSQETPPAADCLEVRPIHSLIHSQGSLGFCCQPWKLGLRMKTIPACYSFQKIQRATLEMPMCCSSCPTPMPPIVMETTQNSEPLHIFRGGYIPSGGCRYPLVVGLIRQLPVLICDHIFSIILLGLILELLARKLCWMVTTRTFGRPLSICKMKTTMFLRRATVFFPECIAVHKCVHVMWAWCLWRPEGGPGSFGIGVTDRCKPPWGCWRPGPS